ncbi:glutamate decarboxylase 1 [Diplogelasinospora grovesii]|uniref:Glutamate decarboxylase 1 n=1 Tax=Diplogelasinospora grovesii TaxID=303347 RepID=A0AAN6ND54_9PEZI|nr:glutamate decarboxylase 1 [Diplogelasinospora grovesii]
MGQQQSQQQAVVEAPLNRAGEVEDLIDAVKTLILPFIRAADEAAPLKATGEAQPKRNALVVSRKPEELIEQLALSLPEGEGRGKDGLLKTIADILEHSVNTWDQGFLDKLYASTNAVGVISELLLSVLNTNLHVYQVSPALTVIEKHTAKTLAGLFGLNGPRAGGVTCQGGSSSNLTSLVIARNTLYPETKTRGNYLPFAIFTSEHGHYSVEKAAITCGMGSAAVHKVPVMPGSGGCMSISGLRDSIESAKSRGKIPLYVNATAGTTVFGSYDCFDRISEVCKEYGIWMHIDASWGGPAIFSQKYKHKMRGSHLADSLTVNPHKMLNAPVTCSFLLGPDMAVFHKANTLPAGYLFHSPEPVTNGVEGGEPGEGENVPEVWDLADLTLQCGRRGDALKLALSWIYYGAAGFERMVDHGFATAEYMTDIIKEREDFVLLSDDPPACLQICFYYAPGGQLSEDKKVNTARTRAMVEKLIHRGFMVDYAPGDKGSFFRVVVNAQTLRTTVDGLVKALEAVGKEVTAGESA